MCQHQYHNKDYLHKYHYKYHNKVNFQFLFKHNNKDLHLEPYRQHTWTTYPTRDLNKFFLTRIH